MMTMEQEILEHATLAKANGMEISIDDMNAKIVIKGKLHDWSFTGDDADDLLDEMQKVADYYPSVTVKDALFAKFYVKDSIVS